MGFLLEEADRVAGCDRGLADEVGVDSAENFEKARFSRAVESEDADFCAVKIRKADIFQHLLGSVALGNTVHRVDDFLVVECLCHNRQCTGKSGIWLSR